MKKRLGFVSNSSSSSFIVISDDYNEYFMEEFKQEYEQYFDYENNFIYRPKTQFNWSFVIYDKMNEKFDWCCLMLYYIQHEPIYEEYYQNFYSFMKELFPDMNQCIYYDESDEWDCDDGYIDHQSYEIEENWKMLESVESIKNFIFGNSRVYGGNDNSKYYWTEDGILKERNYDDYNIFY